MWLNQLPDAVKLNDILAWYDGIGVADRKTKESPSRAAIVDGALAHGGRYLAFDGADSKITYASEILGAGAISIMAWILVTDHGEGNTGRICDNGKVLFAISDDSDRLIFSNNGGGTTALGGPNGIVDGGEYFVCVTRNSIGTKTNMYIDGVLSGSADQSGGVISAGTTALIIGNNSATSATFKGSIANFIAIKGVLTADQIRQVYNEHK